MKLGEICCKLNDFTLATDNDKVVTFSLLSILAPEFCETPLPNGWMAMQSFRLYELTNAIISQVWIFYS